MTSDCLDELGADDQADGHDARSPHEPDAHGEPVEILLRHRRASDRRGNTPTKEVGQSPALAAVQQDQDDEQRTGDGQKHCKNDGENAYVKPAVRPPGKTKSSTLPAITR